MTKINSTGRSTMPRRLGTGLTLALAMSATACQEANKQFLQVTDPESGFNTTSGTEAPNEFQTVGPPSYFIFRVNVGY